MRRYLNEFLSDRRVIDYPAWKWQPLLQTVILSQAALHLGRQLPQDLEQRAQREPAPDHHQGADGGGCASALAARHGRRRAGRFRHALRQPLDAVGGAPDGRGRAASASSSSRSTRITPAPTTATANDQFFRALMAETWQPVGRACRALLRGPRLHRGAGAARCERGWEAAERASPSCWSARYHGMPERYLMRGRPLPLPVPEDDAAAARGAGLAEGARSRTTFQSRLRPRGMAEALHRRGGRAAGARGGHEADRGLRAGLLGRLHRDAGGDPGRDPRGLRARGRASSSPTSPASTTTRRISTRWRARSCARLGGLGLRMDARTGRFVVMGVSGVGQDRHRPAARPGAGRALRRGRRPPHARRPATRWPGARPLPTRTAGPGSTAWARRWPRGSRRSWPPARR